MKRASRFVFSRLGFLMVGLVLCTVIFFIVMARLEGSARFDGEGFWMGLFRESVGKELADAKSGEFSVGIQETFVDQQSVSLKTLLEGSIQLMPVNASIGDKVYPGQAVRICVVLKNCGEVASDGGEMYVRFGFEGPLQDHPKSVIFQTERVSVPALAVGEERQMVFFEEHQWPSLIDYLESNWSMRQYQAVYVCRGEEHLVGNLALSVSAYYYPVAQVKMVAVL